MASRPWVQPSDVTAYSEYAQVQSRTQARLAIDIQRAEQYVIGYTKNDFSDEETIPENVKTAVILLAEAYAYKAGADSVTGGRRAKSETFDDYSYTADESYSADGVFADIKALLEPYCLTPTKNNITLRMRAI